MENPSSLKTSERVLSVLIIMLLAAVFVGGAGVFALRYNALFVPEETPVETDWGDAEVSGHTLTLHMATSEISQSLSDDELREYNTYGFPQGESPYFIYVEKGAHTLSVFAKDGYGLYTERVATWYTATGVNDSLTPVGVFAVGKKEEWHEWPSHMYSPYSTVYSTVWNHYGGLFIHGPIYRTQNLRTVSDGSVMQIGTNASSGCLRTETEAAYFVYSQCPEGTMVKIADGSPFGFVPYRNVYVFNQTVAPNIEKFQLASVAPEKIAFAEESHTMQVGEVYCPEIVTTPSYARDISGAWSSNHPDIVKVSGSAIWGVSPGSAIVYLQSADGKLSASMLIHVTAGNVDTSAPPPDVGGSNTDLSDEDMLASYQPIDMEKLRLKINGKVYSLDENVKPLLRELGAGKYHLDVFQSCAYVGQDKSFTYTDWINGTLCKCTVTTVPMVKGEDNICEISVKNGSKTDLETVDGIRLGDSKADIERVYGRYYTEILVVGGDKDSYIKMTYWAGIPNKSGQPALYFYLKPDTNTVIGMGIYSGRNFV